MSIAKPQSDSPSAAPIDVASWLNDSELHAEIVAAQAQLTTGLDQAIHCRPIPQIAMQILEASEKFDLKTVVSLVEIEPAYCVNLLTLANSPLYGHSREITSIQQAIVLIGFNNLNKLVLLLATKEVFDQGDHSKHQMEIYSHSLATAAVAQTLAAHHNEAIDANAAFLAGMLHDIGKLVLFDLAPKTSARLKNATQHGHHVAIEQSLFGIDHGQLGGKIGDSWMLPRTVNDAIACHHDNELPTETIPALVALANQMAKEWEMGGETAPPKPDLFDHPIFHDIHGDPDELRAASHERFDILKSLFMG